MGLYRRIRSKASDAAFLYDAMDDGDPTHGDEERLRGLETALGDGERRIAALSHQLSLIAELQEKAGMLIK